MNAPNYEITEAMQFDRLPPSSVESEICLLGSLMQKPDAAIFAKARALVRRDSFFETRHQILFDVIGDVYDRRGTIDAMLVREELVKRNLLGGIGGIEALMEMMQSVPAVEHAVHYAGIIAEKAALRSAITVANGIIRQAYAPTSSQSPVQDILARAGADLGKIASGSTIGIVSIGDVLDEMLGNGPAGLASRRLPSGWVSYDKLCGGWPKGKFMIIGGRPGMGKSIVGKIAMVQAARQGFRAGHITVEEDRWKVAQNLLSDASGIENNHIAYGNCDEWEWNEISRAADKLRDLPLFISDTPVRLAEVEAAVAALVLEKKCQIICVDYAQVIEVGGENQNIRVQTVCRALKRLAKTFDIPLLCAAQLNRDTEKESRKPRLSDLRDSGAIEQDGDVIILLHRNDYYNKKEPGFQPDRILEFIVEKNKDGPTGTVAMHFEVKTQSIRDLPPAEPVDDHPF